MSHRKFGGTNCEGGDKGSHKVIITNKRDGNNKGVNGEPRQISETGIKEGFLSKILDSQL